VQSCRAFLSIIAARNRDGRAGTKVPDDLDNEDNPEWGDSGPEIKGTARGRTLAFSSFQNVFRAAVTSMRVALSDTGYVYLEIGFGQIQPECPIIESKQ
jgi:hypothetical protein